MFYLVGLGLGDVKDITVKGLEVVKNAERVYLEAYTSILTVGKEALEEYYGRKIILADRDMVEQQSDELLDGTDKSDVAFLVVGDPLERQPTLTLSCELLRRYFFISDMLFPQRFYDFDKYIKMKEQTIENLMKGNKIFEPPRFMSVSQAAEQLLEIVQRKGEEGGQNLALSEDTVCVGLARVGCDDQKICVATLKQLTSVDLGEPLHSLAIPGHMHPLEIDMLNLFALDDSVKTHLQSCLPSS
ncbi:diphthine methyl ester synthase-like [Haliotis rubra]|uniref:diphthine methyl ester synthase-like n=1 Tax=Haliotis rubra TaxID=36100 RepID=UPI001EE5C0F4|nr:diphthine methyl ester synthase-like [Haliotis rubra]